MPGWSEARADLVREIVAGGTLTEQAAASWLWELEARPEQLAPTGDWRVWLVLAGRGWGKTRTGAAWVQGIAERNRHARIALVAPTAADVRDVMVEGESGILAKAPPWCRPRYEPSKRRLTWPSGAMGTTFSADEPDRFRGPQHTHAWGDELAAWAYPDSWDQLMFGLRLGECPQALVTTTPRPVSIIRELMKARTTVLTRGRSEDNRANLAETFFSQIVKKYEGTRLGRQELDGEVLEDTPGAFWTRAQLDELTERKSPECKRVVVAVDPAVTSNEKSDETGIVVAGIDSAGFGHVLADYSGIYTPEQWARVVVKAFQTHHADRVVAEVNNGGDLVETVLRTVDRNISFRAVRASRGKATRAEPVASLYEQKRVKHLLGLAKLEDQMCTWSPALDAGSPDRVDALVWAITELMLGTSSTEQGGGTGAGVSLDDQGIGF